jgi:mannosyl-3-phosphoglycerate phosphatase
LAANYVVCTDLDGSLLNHGDYSFKEALPLLSYLQTHHIDLIYVTSKTRKECLLLQKEMGIASPFIVENGAAIFYPEGRCEVLGRPHDEIVTFLEEHKERYGIEAFYDMPLEQLMERTGFDKEQAALAKEREFSEPFLLRDELQLEKLRKSAEDEGFSILKGGRFYHCVGADQDKGRAVRLLLKNYPNHQSIGLGDNFNDIAMLDVVDIAILIPRYSGDFIPYEREGLRRAYCPGSLGWREALKEVLADVS